MQQVRTTVELATQDLRERWHADDVDVHGQGYTLRWENEAPPVENVREATDVMKRIANRNPNADVDGQGDGEGYRVAVWFSGEDDA